MSDWYWTSSQLMEWRPRPVVDDIKTEDEGTEPDPKKVDEEADEPETEVPAEEPKTDEAPE